MRRMNKRGEEGEEIMIFPRLFLLMMIGAGMVIGILIFYGSEYDDRAIEARILSYKIAECLKNSDMDRVKADLFKECMINKGSFDEGKFILKICESKDIDSCLKMDGPLFTQGSNFEGCYLNVLEGKEYPKCDERFVNINGKDFVVIAGSKNSIIRSTG